MRGEGFPCGSEVDDTGGEVEEIADKQCMHSTPMRCSYIAKDKAYSRPNHRIANLLACCSTRKHTVPHKCQCTHNRHGNQPSIEVGQSLQDTRIRSHHTIHRHIRQGKNHREHDSYAQGPKKEKADNGGERREARGERGEVSGER